MPASSGTPGVFANAANMLQTAKMAVRHWLWLREQRAIARRIPTRQLNARELDVLLAGLREAGVGGL